MNLTRKGVALFAFGLGLLSAGDAQAKKTRTVVDRIVAVVDSACITKSALDRELIPYRKELGARHGLDADARKAALEALEKSTLRQMIDTRVLVKAAEAARFTATVEEVDRAIVEVASSNKRTVKELLAELPSLGYDEAEYRRSTRQQLMVARLVSYETGKRVAGFAKLSPAEQRQKSVAVERDLVSELRRAVHIEERL